ncbi:MAG TPA: multicopper oxidase domain-containing protein [Nitrososphaera sp.]|nr:multicopper oxidase domain-containing protein [Nitrososphaera sp.]
MQTRENKDDRRKRIRITLGMSAILVVGLIFTSVFTMLLVPPNYELNARAQDTERNRFEETSLGHYNSGPNTSQKRMRQITLIAQDAEIEIAPGKTVKMWTFNGTVPAPPLRFTEGENVSIKFINKTPVPHTIHFHGNHDDKNDGVSPQVMPNESYTYNITAAPAGALMYHCHAYPTSLHIRMGMYGAMIVDPKDKPLEPAREFVMVMGEYDSKEIMKFEAEYYPINGYADQYITNPLEVNHGELVRMYIINIGTTIPYQFHLHSSTFKAYPSGLLSNEPIDAQTYPIGPGDAAIIEARWKYPGTYLFHSHGIQEERGNMGQIEISTNESQSAGLLTESVSMFDWQYDLQKQLQKPKIVNYDEQMLNENAAKTVQSSGHGNAHGRSSSSNSSLTADNPSNIPTHLEPTSNVTGAKISTTSTLSSGGSSVTTVSIVRAALNPSSAQFYNPSPVTVKSGSTIRWINEDLAPHTATLSIPHDGGASVANFDTGIIAPGQSADQVISQSKGVWEYYCTLHPYMKGTINIEE